MDYFQKRQVVLDYVMENPAVMRSTLIHALPSLIRGMQLTEAKELVNELSLQGDLAKAIPVDGRRKPYTQVGRPPTFYIVSPALQEFIINQRRKREYETAR